MTLKKFQQSELNMLKKQNSKHKREKCKKYESFNANGWLGKNDEYCINCLKDRESHNPAPEDKCKCNVGYGAPDVKFKDLTCPIHNPASDKEAWDFDKKRADIVKKNDPALYNAIIKSALKKQKQEIIRELKEKISLMKVPQKLYKGTVSAERIIAGNETLLQVIKLLKKMGDKI